MEKTKKTTTEFINVNILDIRKPPQEDPGSIHLVNVDTILYSQETDNLVHGGRQIDAINVGQFVEASAQAKLIMDSITIDMDMLQYQKEPLDLLIFGIAIIAPEVTPDAVEKKVKSLKVVKGLLVAPRTLAEKIQSKTFEQNGLIIFYDTPNFRVATGRLVLDEDYLQSLADQTLLIVSGSLRLPSVLPEGLMKKKIKRIHPLDGILCHEENAAELRALIKDESKSIKTIPAGFQLIEEPLTLSNFSLENLMSKKLFCREWVLIEANVDPKNLKQHLDRLISSEQIFCPVSCKDALADKVDWTRSDVVYYQGDMWLIDDDRTLDVETLKSTKGKATLVVLGQLSIDPKVEPAMFSKVVDRIHLLGNLRCSRELMPTVREKLGTRDGNIEDIAHKHNEIEPDDEEGAQDERGKSFVNVPYVAL